eukprot:353939-Chlamydomonas_euryale.AAC.4
MHGTVGPASGIWGHPSHAAVRGREWEGNGAEEAPFDCGRRIRTSHILAQAPPAAASCPGAQRGRGSAGRGFPTAAAAHARDGGSSRRSSPALSFASAHPRSPSRLPADAPR